MATMIISFVSLLAVGVPVTWALSRLWGTDGVWAGLAAGEVIQAAGIIAYFRAGRWKRKKL
jgi:Na+-driven multidrug efflux pump